jgi:hypothetical protein
MADQLSEWQKQTASTLPLILVHNKRLCPDRTDCGAQPLFMLSNTSFGFVRSSNGKPLCSGPAFRSKLATLFGSVREPLKKAAAVIV